MSEDLGGQDGWLGETRGKRINEVTEVTVLSGFSRDPLYCTARYLLLALLRG